MILLKILLLSFRLQNFVDVGWLVGRLHSSNAESFLAVVNCKKVSDLYG